MNVANVIPLSAPHAVPYAKSEHPAAVDPARVRFGVFQLDEANARLLRDGTAVALAPTPFAVLCALARHPGSLLTTNALLDDVWGHRFVTDSVLKTAISEARAALGDDARKPRFIETVSRRGYRFIALTTAIPSTPATADKAPVQAIDFAERPSCKSRSEMRAHPSGAWDGVCGGKRTGLCAVPKVPTSRRDTGCALPQPVFTTREEVCYAHQLRLQLRARLLRDAAPAAEHWSVGAH